MKFEIGDKVIHNRFGKGIVKVFPKNWEGGVGVEFEQESILLFHDLFHDGRPYAKLHHGYWVTEDDLIKDGKQEENMIRFKVGDRVKHDSYGLGIVEEINMNLAFLGQTSSRYRNLGNKYCYLMTKPHNLLGAVK